MVMAVLRCEVAGELTSTVCLSRWYV